MRKDHEEALKVKKRRSLVLVVTVISIFALDIATKYLVFNACGAVIREGKVVDARSIVVIPGFFELQCVMNPGAFSGWFSGWHAFLVVISIAALVAIFLYVLSGRCKRELLVLCLGLIGGGTAGNLYDRLLYGAVRDFFRFFITLEGGRTLTWPNFNVADTSICVGVGLWIFLELRGSAPKN